VKVAAEKNASTFSCNTFAWTSNNRAQKNMSCMNNNLMFWW